MSTYLLAAATVGTGCLLGGCPSQPHCHIENGNQNFHLSRSRMSFYHLLLFHRKKFDPLFTIYLLTVTIAKFPAICCRTTPELSSYQFERQLIGAMRPTNQYNLSTKLSTAILKKRLGLLLCWTHTLLILLPGKTS